MNELASKCLMLSEFAMGSTAFPQNFPIRNRIISGMGVTLLVVEGAQYRGLAITARLTIDQDREVFVAPSNLTSKMSPGINLLIKQGVKLVLDCDDVVGDRPPEVRRKLIGSGNNSLLTQRLTDSAATTPADQASLLGSQAKISPRFLEKLKPDASTHLDALGKDVDGFTTTKLIAAYLNWR
jgi:DNA processing protein